VDFIQSFSDPEAASKALMACALALSAASIAVTGLCLAYVAKTVREWMAWGVGRNKTDT
jgi:hypothetical protein